MTSLEPVGFVYPDPVAVCLDILRVPEPKTVKNRVHIDLATTSAAHQADLVARLQALGATPADVGQGADVSWMCLADPEGTSSTSLPRAERAPDEQMGSTGAGRLDTTAGSSRTT